MLALLLVPSPAFAYIDPGIGNVFVQSMIAAVAAAAFTLKVFWAKIVGLFVRTKKDSASSEDGPERDD
jgi:hypothetical protein